VDRKIKIKLWENSWLKLLACIESELTQIDTLGDWEYVYRRNSKTNKILKDEEGKPIYVKDPETNRPLKESIDFDPTIKFYKVVNEIRNQLSKALR